MKVEIKFTVDTDSGVVALAQAEVSLKALFLAGAGLINTIAMESGDPHEEIASVMAKTAKTSVHAGRVH